MGNQSRSQAAARSNTYILWNIRLLPPHHSSYAIPHLEYNHQRLPQPSCHAPAVLASALEAPSRTPAAAPPAQTSRDHGPRSHEQGSAKHTPWNTRLCILHDNTSNSPLPQPACHPPAVLAPALGAHSRSPAAVPPAQTGRDRGPWSHVQGGGEQHCQSAGHPSCRMFPGQKHHSPHRLRRALRYERTMQGLWLGHKIQTPGATAMVVEVNCPHCKLI